jgi:hypothetical protein
MRRECNTGGEATLVEDFAKLEILPGHVHELQWR